VLGTIESGVDFEKRILAIYQDCRTPEAIATAFDELQAQIEDQIRGRMEDTRRALLENFDEDVHARLKLRLPSLFAGVLAGALVAIFLQGATLHEVFIYAQSGYTIETGVADIDSLLNSGGIQSMMWTISLMLIALGFGGALERTGCLEAIIQAIIGRVKSFAAVQSAAIGTAFATSLVAGDPYISIALPGRMYAPLYRGMGYSTLNLSRAVEEGGTLMSPLIPWNAGGAFVISALGLGIMSGNLENLLYIPLAFACWTAPLIGIFYAVTGLFSPRATDAERQDWEKSNEDVLDLKDHALADTKTI
jgi:NhaC family Na+:H+ antiporter